MNSGTNPKMNVIVAFKTHRLRKRHSRSEHLWKFVLSHRCPARSVPRTATVSCSVDFGDLRIRESVQFSFVHDPIRVRTGFSPVLPAVPSLL